MKRSLKFGSRRGLAAKGPPSKMMELPEELRGDVERRLIEHGFRNYKSLAGWIRQQGHEISVSCLKRYGLRLARDLESTRLAMAQVRAIAGAVPGGAGAITGGLVQLVQQKLCSALAEIDRLKQDDMWRAAHAIARLTQAAISLQRWNDEVKRRTGEKGRRAQAEANEGGGLSKETSDALRNALLGIAPFDPEHIEAERAGPARSEAGTPPGTAKAEEFNAYEEAARAGPSEPVKKLNGLDDGGVD